MAPITAQSRKIAGFGPHSRKSALARMDKRSAEGRHLRRIREQLKQHLGGGELSFVQSQLIERASWLSLHISLFDNKVAAGHEPTQVDSNIYLSWVSAFNKALLSIDRKLVPEPDANASADDLQRYIAMRAEAAEREA